MSLMSTSTIASRIGWQEEPTKYGRIQQAELVASDASAADYFGYSVSISDDGNTCVIGSYLDDISTSVNQGSAYVFTRSGSTWTQQAKLVASDGTNSDLFGWSVSISSDGGTCVIGARNGDLNPDSNLGSAYVFTRSGSTWTQQAKLLASDGSGYDDFGNSVSISSDGNTCVIGSPSDDISTATNRGSAYVFTRSGSTWTQQAKLLASGGAVDDYFGNSVSISSDGNTCVIGAYLGGGPFLSYIGSAYVFTRSGSTWTQQAKLVASDGSFGDWFGISVSISSDGNTCIVGSQNDISGGASLPNGSAYVFTRSGSTWTQQSKLLASDGSEGSYDGGFGRSVSISNDGVTSIIGHPYHTVGSTTNQGVAYIFTLDI